MVAPTPQALLCRSLLLASLLSLGSGLSADTAAHTAMPRKFSQLPLQTQQQINLGQARTSSQIAASPFGTHTTILQEGGAESYQKAAPDLIANAGYKWVMDYISIGSTANMSVADVEHKFARLPERYFRYAQALQDRGISLMIRIDPLPWTPWDGTRVADYSPGSADMQKSEAFTREVVRQMKPYTRYWQIWNEPNIGNESPYVQPADFVQIVAILAKVIRQEQPDAVIMAPGTAMLQCMAERPYPWIPQVLDAGLLEHIDVFTFHPYRQPATLQNIPENASEFFPWQIWGSYENQIADLRKRLRESATGSGEVPLAATEDGTPNTINGEGEQEVSWIVGAKYELRRALLDFHLNVKPRIQFCLYRPIGENYYDKQGSFNLVTNDMQPKPAYYAAQNLHAVLDESHLRDDTSGAKIIFNNAAPATAKPQIQVYRKDGKNFDELLVFFWSAEPSADRHIRYPATLSLEQNGWEAPMLIDLMAMPTQKPHNEIIDHLRSDFVNRIGPKELVAHRKGSTLSIPAIELRDYPQLIKLVRLHPQADQAAGN